MTEMLWATTSCMSPRDPCSLGGRRQSRLLVTLDFEGRRPLLDRGEIGAPGAGVVAADTRGRGRAREQDEQRRRRSGRRAQCTVASNSATSRTTAAAMVRRRGSRAATV